MVKEQRMCSVALRHLSGIQKGIQSAHAIVDYSLKYGDTPEYQRWAKKDKTLYVLEAHSTEQLEDAYKELRKLKVPVEKFIEPDLGGITTAIAFLLDEVVWNTKKYGDTLDGTAIAIRRIKNQFNLATN
jgi:pyridoxine 5'-phosphate synthase PdxJ